MVADHCSTTDLTELRRVFPRYSTRSTDRDLECPLPWKRADRESFRLRCNRLRQRIQVDCRWRNSSQSQELPLHNQARPRLCPSLGVRSETSKDPGAYQGEAFHLKCYGPFGCS